MFTLVRVLPLRTVLASQVVPIGIALVLAEAFYKFGSFTLECLAFLATWFVLDGLGNGLAAVSRRVRGPADRPS